MTFRSSFKRFVLHHLRIGFQAKPLFIFYGLLFLGFYFTLPNFIQAQIFEDVPVETLYYPYIEDLASAHLISGDTDISGRPTGAFRPEDQLNRAELAKIAVTLRLAEKRGKKDDWEELSAFQVDQEVFDLLEEFLNCDEGACESIGDQPFSDVPEIDSNCVESNDASLACSPWFTKFIYYAADKGFVKGHAPKPGETKRRYGTDEPILRLHAIKMMVVDNGNIEPSKDDRFKDLDDRADDNKSYKPICLAGAENIILDMAGGNTPDNQKLLEYAIMADRLDFFGMSCMLFTNEELYSDAQRAEWLMKPITRQEAARWFVLSSLYDPVVPDPEEDDTISSADENEGTDSDDKDYEIPEYEPTEFLLQPKKQKDDYYLPELPSGTQGLDFVSTLPDNATMVACLSKPLDGRPILEFLYEDYQDNPYDLVFIDEYLLKEDAGSDCDFFGDNLSVSELYSRAKDYIFTFMELIDESWTLQDLMELMDQRLKEDLGLEVPEEDKVDSLKGCPAGKDMEYDLVSVSQNPVYFESGEGQKTIQIKIKNKGAEAWGEKCSMQLTLSTENGLNWRDKKNQEREARGFDDSGRILGFQVGEVNTQVNEAAQTAVIEVSLGASSNGRYMDQFHINNAGPANPLIWGVYLYGQKESGAIQDRAFRTSVDSVRVRRQPLAEAEELKVIPAADIPITVTGHAVMGQYVDAYKSYMWYPVEVDGVKGFVEAPTLHAEKLNRKPLDTKLFGREILWVNRIVFGGKYDGESRYKTTRAYDTKGITLHTTAGSAYKTAATERDHFDGIARFGAHYYVGRDGDVAQAAPDFYHIDHAGHVNAFAIGIEILNSGTVQNNFGPLGSIVHEGDVEDISVAFPEKWNLWHHALNYTHSGVNNSIAAKDITQWQTFSQDQMSALAELIKYIQERYDIPTKFYHEGQIDHENESFYVSEDNGMTFYPDSVLNRSPDLQNFYGIYGHHNVNGKFDPGPLLNITQLKNLIQ